MEKCKYVWAMCVSGMSVRWHVFSLNSLIFQRQSSWTILPRKWGTYQGFGGGPSSHWRREEAAGPGSRAKEPVSTLQLWMELSWKKQGLVFQAEVGFAVTTSKEDMMIVNPPSIIVLCRYWIHASVIAWDSLVTLCYVMLKVGSLLVAGRKVFYLSCCLW